MITLRKILSKEVLPLLLIFIFIHVVLFDINAAEWGDSYRILRAAEFLKDGSYPKDEKRPVLFSAILSLHPSKMDPVFFGRVVMLVLSVAAFMVFVGLTDNFIEEKNTKKLALLLFIFNPVYLYWSLRIMADIPFSFLVMLVFYLLAKWNKGLNSKKAFFLGLLVSLAILTRFEGYVLFAGVLVGFFFSNGIHSINEITPSELVKKFLVEKKTILVFIIGTLFLLLPYYLYRNPLESAYLSEPGGRRYDLMMFWTYVCSLIFLFGFTSAFYFLGRNRQNICKFFQQHTGLGTFIFIELFLILAWPAAVPRLFVAIIPFLIILLALSIQEFLYDSDTKWTHIVLPQVLLLGLYLLSQYELKLQFLLVGLTVMAIVSIIQLLVVMGSIRKKYYILAGSLIISCIFWSFWIIRSHKDILITIKSAAKYSAQNYQGKITYNDISAVSDWYINYVSTEGTKGTYYDENDKDSLTYENLSKENIDYLILTNEHNINMDIDLSKRPYLLLVKEFKNEVNGQEFFAKILKLDKSYEVAKEN